MTTDRKPWMVVDGNVAPTERLMDVAKSWSPEIWEDFLQTTVDKPLRESLVNHDCGEEVDQSALDAYQDMMTQVRHPHLESLVRVLMKKLTIREQSVLHAIFWDGKSQKEIAAQLRIGRSSVLNYRDRALKKLGAMFMARLAAVPLQDERETRSQRFDSTNANWLVGTSACG